ncbi:MAG: AMP-binding protein, partial [Deltaproteobacteria bacterium]|nr:AMP-binding protein [Deltaproteobacteria bacterium]
MNIGTLLPRHARCRPHHPAVLFEADVYNYGEFNRRVNRLANALLALGVTKGDKVATLLPNCLELLDTYWAVAKIGAVVVPLSQLTRGKGLVTMLNDSDSVCVITDSAFVEHLDRERGALTIPEHRYLLTGAMTAPGYSSYDALTAAASDTDAEGIQIDASDPYNIMYTSGTTGQPKGIVHTHLIRAMYGTLMANSFRMTPESVILHAGSIVFNGAFVTLMPAFFMGGTYILHRQFNPQRFIETVEREKVTHVIMVPSQIIAVMHAPNFSASALHTLEMLCTVGAPLHQEHKDELSRRLPGRFYELYGLTEGFVTILDKNDYESKGRSVGVPPPLFEMRIIDDEGRDVPSGKVGEIVGRGPILMPGYYKRPDLTSEAIINGWLHTGDMGHVDEEGYLYLVDRKKDMIISGGVNVYPRDIEEIAVQHPAVQEVAVF